MWTGLFLAVILPTLGLAVLGLLSHRPHDWEATDGRLAPCPDSPNCVSSMAEQASQRVDPIPFTGSAVEAKRRLIEVISALPRTRIVKHAENYVRVEFTSRLFRFVDDVELLIDGESQVIHLRSASRVGYSDFGANRRRVERIRAAFSPRS